VTTEQLDPRWQKAVTWHAGLSMGRRKVEYNATIRIILDRLQDVTTLEALQARYDAGLEWTVAIAVRVPRYTGALGHRAYRRCRLWAAGPADSGLPGAPHGALAEANARDRLLNRRQILIGRVGADIPDHAYQAVDMGAMRGRDGDHRAGGTILAGDQGPRQQRRGAGEREYPKVRCRLGPPEWGEGQRSAACNWVSWLFPPPPVG